jgi:hypothetical protein
MRRNENGTMIFDAYLFVLFTCNCSRRTAGMEEKYGSYCDICWEIIRKNYVVLRAELPLKKRDFLLIRPRK